MVTLLATGGTIASIAGPTGRVVGVSGTDLHDRASQVWPLPPVTIEETRSLISSALSGEDISELAQRCSPTRPTVITHGTDAMEETAIALALFRSPTDAPVVLTGAQRPFDDPAPDGPRNLAAAIAWAASPAAQGTGVTVVFGDGVFPAIGVRKSHTLALTGFSAPGRGPIGVVDEGGARRFALPALPSPLLGDHSPDLARVHVLTSHLGTDPRVLEAILELEDAPIVVEGMGSGNAPPALTRTLVRAAQAGTPIVVTSRTGAGTTVGLYAGGGADLAEAGAVFAGDLSTAQARWVLAVALTHGEAWRNRLSNWLIEAGCVAG